MKKKHFGLGPPVSSRNISDTTEQLAKQISLVYFRGPQKKEHSQLNSYLFKHDRNPFG